MEDQILEESHEISRAFKEFISYEIVGDCDGEIGDRGIVNYEGKETPAWLTLSPFDNVQGELGWIFIDPIYHDLTWVKTKKKH